MASEHWFRWHHGTVNDPKWRVIAARASHAMSRNVTQASVIAVWASMLECASQANPRGEIIGWDDEDVSANLGIDLAEVQAIRLSMQGKTLGGDRLTAWNKRQVAREDGTASSRKQAQRDREKSREQENPKRDNNECHASSRNVTPEERRGEEKRERAKALDHRADDRRRIEVDFTTRFWPAYPKKKAKPDALKAFARIKPDEATLDRMLAALAVQKQSDDWQRSDGQFIPYPATWLNGRRWEDEAPKAATFGDQRLAL